jgi:hypothetical protein
MLKNLSFLFLIVCFTKSSSGQNNSQINLEATGIWNGAYIKGKITNKLGYYGEHHYRLGNSPENVASFVGRTRQIYNRAGLNIFVNPHFEIVVGPTLVFNFTPDPGNPNFEKVTLEPRIWHQWLFTGHEIGRAKVYHQFRFEHRWKRTNEINSAAKYTNRYRYKLFAYIPINTKKIKEKTLYFSPSAEIFMHSGKSIVYNPFEDFRTYNGFGYVYNKNITFFAGHMWTLGQKSTGFEYRTSHILRFNIMIGFDARKIENKLPSINLGF